MSWARNIIALLILVFAASSPAHAGEGAQSFMQGVVSSFDATSFVLNEGRKVNIDGDTAYFDSRGRQSTIQVIAERKWLYVEGSLEHDGSVTAEKVYALPGYISRQNRHKYEFMQLP